MKLALTPEDHLHATERIAALWDLPLTAVYMARCDLDEDHRQINFWICIRCGAIRQLRYCRHEPVRYNFTNTTSSGFSGPVTLVGDWSVS